MDRTSTLAVRMAFFVLLIGAALAVVSIPAALSLALLAIVILGIATFFAVKYPEQQPQPQKNSEKKEEK